MKQGWIQVNNNGIKDPLAPKSMADMVYVDEPQSQTVKDALSEVNAAIKLRTPIDMTAQFPAYGWSSAAPYTQTVQVIGLLATDVPLADVILSDTASIALEEMEAYGCVGRMDAENGDLTAYCYESKPDVNLTIRLKVVR